MMRRAQGIMIPGSIGGHQFKLMIYTLDNVHELTKLFHSKIFYGFIF